MFLRAAVRLNELCKRGSSCAAGPTLIKGKAALDTFPQKGIYLSFCSHPHAC